MSKSKRRKIFKDEITGAIDKLSKSYVSKLEEQELAYLKQRCQRSKEDLNHTYIILMDYLMKNDAKVRYNTIKVINEIYLRSHTFRLLVHERLHEVFIYTVETEPRVHPLQLPLTLAGKLKMFSLKVFAFWFSKYSNYYRKLQLGFQFLKNVHKIDFDKIEQKIQEEKAHKEYLDRMKMKESEEHVRKILKEAEKYKSHTKSCLLQINSCYELIIPKISSSVLNTESESNIAINSGIIGSEFGVSGRNFTVEIRLNAKQEVYETNDNKEILNALTESYKELSYQLSKLKKWLTNLKKYSCKDRGKISELFELKIEIEDALRKYDELIIIEEDNDDFIEVPETSG